MRLGVNHGILDATISRLHALPVAYHRKETALGIMTKLDRGVNGFVGAVSDIAFNVFPGIVYPAISPVIMFSPDARLSLTVLFFAPLPALILASMELRPDPKRSFRRAAQNPWVF